MAYTLTNPQFWYVYLHAGFSKSAKKQLFSEMKVKRDKKMSITVIP